MPRKMLDGIRFVFALAFGVYFILYLFAGPSMLIWESASALLRRQQFGWFFGYFFGVMPLSVQIGILSSRCSVWLGFSSHQRAVKFVVFFASCFYGGYLLHVWIEAGR